MGGKMTRNWVKAWALVAGLSLSAVAQAEELLFPSLFNRAPAAQTRIDAPIRLVSCETGDCGAVDCEVCEAACDVCDPCCKSGGLIAGGEILIMKAFETETVYNDFNYDPGYRLWLGAQNAEGLGFVVRYFNYAQIANNNDRFHSYLFDLEGIDTMTLGGRWNVTLGAGVRYGDIFDSNAADNFAGTGPTASVFLTRPVFSDFSFYGGARGSLLFGTMTNGANFDVTMQIIELSAGVQWNRTLQSGATAFLRSGWEGQMYYGYNDNDSEGVGLVGLTFAAGIAR